MKIEEKDTTIIIDGFEYEGFIDEEQLCTICKSNHIYYDKFDSYFCPKCNYWIEKQCGDPNCDYCSRRPKKPLPSNL